MIRIKFKRKKYDDTYHINTPLETDHRISLCTILIVLVLLARSYISILHNNHRKLNYYRVNPKLLLYSMKHIVAVTTPSRRILQPYTPYTRSCKKDERKLAHVESFPVCV
jgi:hypothetical protein